MTFPLQISFRRMSRSSGIEQMISEKSAKLSKFSSQIITCRVTVDLPHRHHQSGNEFHLSIEISTSQGKIIIDHERGDCDITVAIREAFDSAARKLEEAMRKHRHQVKLHETSPQAKIVRLFLEDGYGFLETPDGREIYFHENSVLNASFDNLAPGVAVTFTEEPGKKGPQASTVRLADL